MKTLEDFDRELGRGGVESRGGRMSLDTEAREAPITVKAAARFLGVSPSLVYAYVERKQIPHYRMMGRSIRFRLSELVEWRQQFHVNRNFLFGLPAFENIHASASQRVQCFLREDHRLRASLSGSPKPEFPFWPSGD